MLIPHNRQLCSCWRVCSKSAADIWSVQWWRNGSHWSVGLLGAVILILYGIVPTYQPSHFGRVYTAYGGWFIILSILWGG